MSIKFPFNEKHTPKSKERGNLFATNCYAFSVACVHSLYFTFIYSLSKLKLQYREVDYSLYSLVTELLYFLIAGP